MAPRNITGDHSIQDPSRTQQPGGRNKKTEKKKSRFPHTHTRQQPCSSKIVVGHVAAQQHRGGTQHRYIQTQTTYTTSGLVGIHSQYVGTTG